ncbi:extracellular solute-binding protein [Amaricoccus sp.]|uniref:extracellular solute-binding protein n=1 Tax=Amaricoccus sp. TaxID=1872485 RepID=UPI001B4EED25|nr:extracellular solute-binding protein [Amaricoccus sp.]MBP7242922.1 ABC transporter substrate-binding protein [Amaricoccus sp.]
MPDRAVDAAPMKAARRVAGAALAALVALAGPALATDGDVIVSHGISTFGDLKYRAGFPHFDYVNPDAPKGGTMSFRGTGASQTFDSLNAFILKGEPAQGLGLLYDSLLIGSADEIDASYGLVAESLEYPSDRSWVIFHMRPEARFADGEPITAEDVVWSFETLRDKGAPNYRIMLADVAGAEAIDPRTVKFTFKEGVPTRDLPALVGGLSILPKHYYETVPFEESTLTPPVGSGAYEVAAVQPGRSIRYCRVPDYWGANLPVNIGSANFDCYVYEYFADNTAAFEALKSGQYLFHEEFFSAIWANDYTFPALTKGWVKREELPDNRPSGTQGFWMNMRKPQLQDIRVREAIALMFNFEWSNATLFSGNYERTVSFFQNSPMMAEGLPEGEELATLERFRDQLPPEIFSEPAYLPPVSSAERTNDRAAIRRASALLDEAGWTVGPAGLRQNAAGQTLKLEILEDNPSLERVLNPFIANLRQIGIDASLRMVDSAQYEERQKNHDYDMLPTRLVMSMAPSVELRTIFGSEGADAAGSYNLSGVNDPVVDGIIELIVAATTREELDGRVKALDRVLRNKQIWVPNWSKGAFWIAYWDVFGRPEEPPAYSRGDAYWWFDREKYDALKAQGAVLP